MHSNIVYLGTKIESSKSWRAGKGWESRDLPQFCLATGVSILFHGVHRPPEFAYCLDAPDVMAAGSTIQQAGYNVFD